MRSVNKVILIGNLTRDPELRQTPNGQSVTTFGLATNREWNTREGEKKSSAEFHECVAWAKMADICSQYLKKGQLVYIEGYLKTRSWDSPEGVKKFKTEIVVKDMIRLEKRQQENGDDASYSSDDEYINMDEESPMEAPAPMETPAAPAQPAAPAPMEPEAPAMPSPADLEPPQQEDLISKDLGL